MSVTPARFLSARRVAVPLAGLMPLGCLSVVAAGCGRDRSGGPTQEPAVVITKAPDLTLAQGTARIIITAPSADARGVVSFSPEAGQLALNAVGAVKPADLLVAGGVGYLKQAADTSYTRLSSSVPAVLAGGDPWADVDLIRGAVHILSNGGGEVDGLSTISYTLTIDPQQAIETTPPSRQRQLTAALQGRTNLFQMTVWIDSRLLIRRIQVPTDLTVTTPSTRVDRQPIAADVDFPTFGVAVGPISPPTTGGS